MEPPDKLFPCQLRNVRWRGNTYIMDKSSTLIAGSSVKPLITTQITIHVPERNLFSFRNLPP